MMLYSTSVYDTICMTSHNTKDRKYSQKCPPVHAQGHPRVARESRRTTGWGKCTQKTSAKNMGMGSTKRKKTKKIATETPPRVIYDRDKRVQQHTHKQELAFNRFIIAPVCTSSKASGTLIDTTLLLCSVCGTSSKASCTV